MSWPLAGVGDGGCRRRVGKIGATRRRSPASPRSPLSIPRLSWHQPWDLNLTHPMALSNRRSVHRGSRFRSIYQSRQVAGSFFLQRKCWASWDVLAHTIPPAQWESCPPPGSRVAFNFGCPSSSLRWGGSVMNSASLWLLIEGRWFGSRPVHFGQVPGARMCVDPFRAILASKKHLAWE